MKKILLITLIALTIILAGCSGNNTPSGPSYAPFVGGTDALKFEFVPGMPPTQDGAILDSGQSPFSIGLKVTNAGEYDLEPNQLRLNLGGILPEQFGIGWADTVNVLQDPLPGTLKNIGGEVINGQSTILSFDGLSYLPDARGDVLKPFKVSACYFYKTASTTPICVANDVRGSLVDTDNNPVCEVNAVKSVKASSGPVQVTNFRETPQGNNKVNIMFDVVHKGTGNVFTSTANPGIGGPNNCDTSLLNPDRNHVWVSIYLPDESASSINLDCMGGFTTPSQATKATPVEGDVLISDNGGSGLSRTITCSLEELTTGQDVLYQDLLNIDLYYNYGESFDKTIVIKDIGSSSN